MISHPIRVAVLDDHLSIIDGYRFRLALDPQIEIAAAVRWGEALEPALESAGPVDVLLLDVHVPTSPHNPEVYPILHLIPRLLDRWPGLSILVISMHAGRTLVQSALQAGAGGYLLKDDADNLDQLPAVIRQVASGGMPLSSQLRADMLRRLDPLEPPRLTPRQLEALSLSASYPDVSTADLSRRMHVAHSTFRNLLSEAYLRLGVSTRAAAAAQARRLGYLPGDLQLPWDELASS